MVEFSLFINISGGKAAFYIFFLPDRFIYFQHRIPIGFIHSAFSRSRSKKFRRRVVVTSSAMDLGTAGGVSGAAISRLYLVCFDSGGKAVFFAKSL